MGSYDKAPAPVTSLEVPADDVLRPQFIKDALELSKAEGLPIFTLSLEADIENRVLVSKDEPVSSLLLFSRGPLVEDTENFFEQRSITGMMPPRMFAVLAQKNVPIESVSVHGYSPVWLIFRLCSDASCWALRHVLQLQ
jgi:hypothetical protein